MLCFPVRMVKGKAAFPSSKAAPLCVGPVVPASQAASGGSGTGIRQSQAACTRGKVAKSRAKPVCRQVNAAPAGHGPANAVPHLARPRARDEIRAAKPERLGNFANWGKMSCQMQLTGIGSLIPRLGVSLCRFEVLGRDCGRGDARMLPPQNFAQNVAVL